LSAHRNVVQLFERAHEEYEQERREDKMSRKISVCIILLALLYGALCFDLGVRLGAYLAR
jgi:hypothetical protein